MTEFDTKFASFLEGCRTIATEYYAKHFTKSAIPTDWRVDAGKRYLRVVFNGSVHCFVDKTNGAVLKAAGWKAPAKHARGNIFDANNGLGSMGPYGPAYLR